MNYELTCECGDKLTVRETAAGATEMCRCGRSIVVPSLHILRRMAGVPEPGLAPELVVETLLLAGKLPQEEGCVLCGVRTETLIYCKTDCERAYVASGQPRWWAYALGFLTCGWLGVLAAAASRRADREWGKDRIYDLPLRICVACRPSLTSPEDLTAALYRVPVYRALLNKFPDARVTLSPP
jgi:hypothetical protein